MPWYEYTLSFEAEDDKHAAGIGEDIIVAYCKHDEKKNECVNENWVGSGPIKVKFDEED